MRRSVLLIAATAYYLASPPAADVPKLVPVMTGYAQARLGREATRAASLMEGTSADRFTGTYREALNLIRQAVARERRSLESLEELGLTPAARQIVARAVRQLEAVSAANEQALKDRVANLATERTIVLGRLKTVRSRNNSWTSGSQLATTASADR